MTLPSLSCSRAGDTLIIHVGGDWLLDEALPDAAPVLHQLRSSSPPTRLQLDASRVGRWDSALPALLVTLHRAGDASGAAIDDDGLPDGVRRLLALAFAVQAPAGASRGRPRFDVLERAGRRALQVAGGVMAMIDFTGEVVLSMNRLLRGRATYMRAHLFQYVQEAGAQALPIASLITFLIGMIFAFVGVMQLAPFGVGIYTADLVAIAMVREMAPIMTAILMAGRTGAAYAAQIGTMNVNEEVDALTTLGIDPVDFLVTPRVLALTLMLPMLALYGSLMGMLGGMVVALTMLDVSMAQYLRQTIDAVDLHHLWGGLFKSLVFGALVAMAGCHQGLACRGSAMAVGQATTRAVVSGIVLIVISASVLTVIYVNLGI